MKIEKHQNECDDDEDEDDDCLRINLKWNFTKLLSFEISH